MRWNPEEGSFKTGQETLESTQQARHWKRRHMAQNEGVHTVYYTANVVVETLNGSAVNEVCCMLLHARPVIAAESSMFACNI